MRSHYRGFTIVAASALVAVSLLTPSTHRASAQPVPPAACHAGDIVHTIAPGMYSIEPHKGFNPFTSSDAELSCYGMGPQPKDAGGASQWAGAMRNYHYDVPVLSNVSLPSNGLVGSYANPLWVGYENRTTDNGNNYYYAAQAWWTVPTVPSGVNYTSYLSSWVGLGGDRVSYPQSSVIWQAGAEMVTGTTASYFFWLENYGCTPGTSTCVNDGRPVPLSIPAISAGNRVQVLVNASNGETYFNNVSTGHATDIYTSINNNNTGYTAEYIVEEASGGCDSLPPVPCTTFTDPNFSNASYAGTTGNNYFNLVNYFRLDLKDVSDGNKIVAQPPAPTGNGNFSVTCCVF
jgi:hypothetical protein